MKRASEQQTVGLFDEIRRAAAVVAHRARFVHIDEGALDSLAERLASEISLFDATESSDPVLRRRGGDSETLVFVITLDAVNFGSGYFPFMKKRADCSGYMTIATALEERFNAEGAFSANELAELSAADCACLFGQTLESPEMAELMQLFSRSLSDLGRFLQARFEGSFEGLVTAARGRAKDLVGLLAEMPLYRDVARYEELRVPFYKRAQITCADLALAFEGRGSGAFDDIDELTLFADNLVPHVLRREGVLVYSRDLLDRIMRERLLMSDSAEEVEIRACALHAVELLCARLAERGRALPARHLDHLLWERGQNPEMKSEPRHRCRCSFY